MGWGTGGRADMVVVVGVVVKDGSWVRAWLCELWCVEKVLMSVVKEGCL